MSSMWTDMLINESEDTEKKSMSKEELEEIKYAKKRSKEVMTTM